MDQGIGAELCYKQMFLKIWAPVFHSKLVLTLSDRVRYAVRRKGGGGKEVPEPLPGLSCPGQT
jgi:hypothetical protein